MKRQLLLFGIAAVAASALSVVAAVLVMALALWSDVGALEKEVRGATRTTKLIRADIAMLKDGLTSLGERPSVVETLPPPAVSAVPVVTATMARARIVKVGGASPPECVFRPGDVEGLAECIRSHQWPKPATPRYR